MVKISPGHQKNGITGIDENWDNWLFMKLGCAIEIEVQLYAQALVHVVS